jgi:hypothetical protein
MVTISAEISNGHNPNIKALVTLPGVFSFVQTTASNQEILF